METILQCRKFEVVRERVKVADKRETTREYVVHPGSVVVLPLLDDGTCVMIRQFRPCVGQELVELPAGTLDVPGERPEAAAARELEEETGYRASRLSWLCDFFPSPGILSERISAFVAEDLTPTRQKLGPTEKIAVEPMPMPEVLKKMQDGSITDAKTILTVLRWDYNRRTAS